MWFLNQLFDTGVFIVLLAFFAVLILVAFCAVASKIRFGTYKFWS